MLALLAVGLMAAGCGSSAKKHGSTTCPDKVRAAVAGVLSVHASAVITHSGVGSNAEPECDYVIRTANGTVVKLVANLDSSPQPYQRLERAIVEDGQQFATVQTNPPPQTVPHLGLDAAWLPDQNKLITTEGVRLVSVSVAWPGSTQAEQRAVAVATARPYLGKNNPKAVEPPV